MMFEHDVEVKCPHCKKYMEITICYDSSMIPVKTTEKCSRCWSKFTAMPWAFEPDESDVDIEKVGKKGEADE